MDTLWGKFLAVPENKLSILQDQEELIVGNLRIRPMNTPGHAEHHYVYLFEDMCFSGDVGAVRIPGYPYLRLPMPPPEFHLEKWRQTIHELQKLQLNRIAPTHFGIFDDVDWHFQFMLSALDEVEIWLDRNMPGEPALESLKESFLGWMAEQAKRQGLDESAIEAYRLANPLGMSVDGLARYWKKFRAPLA
jgi:glyoxylase-like metal-dependent hydrolase (beta-lactamase superfamily II)